MNAHPRPNLLARIGLRIKRTATFIYGPAQMPQDVDPVDEIDRELGREPSPPAQTPKLSERQQSYDNLPRGTAE